MHANAPLKNKWSEKLARSGFLVGAIVFHLIIFAMIASLVIWKAPPPPPVADDFHGVLVKVPPPAPVPPPSGAVANPQFETQPVTMPAVTPPSVITTTFKSNFAVDSSKDMEQALNHLGQLSAGGAGGGGGNAGSGTGTATAFGSDTASGSQLSGYFYDLKQTPDKKPTGMDLPTYYRTLTDYLNRGWDDATLDPYYKSKTPLYLNQVAISTRGSAEAPKAFHLEKEVQGGLWAIHYHARVVPPEGGDYRFIGFADNVLVVRIDGTTVLDGGWSPLLNSRQSLHEKLPFVFPSFAGVANNIQRPNLKIGSSFHVDDGVAVDMDVLIGDDGGGCAFFLLVKAEDKTYDASPDGTPEIPFFQLGAGPAPVFKAGEEHPPYSTKPEPWTVAK